MIDDKQLDKDCTTALELGEEHESRNGITPQPAPTPSTTVSSREEPQRKPAYVVK